MPDAVRKAFQPSIGLGPLSGLAGFINHEGGWANTSNGIRRITASKVVALGAKIDTGESQKW
jgi:hypothetical protein